MCGSLSERPFFALRMIALLHVLYARSRRQERKLDRLCDHLSRMENMMSENDSTLLAKLSELEAKVNTYTTDQGSRIAAAVSAARAAQKSEDKAAADAEMAAALAEIEKIGSGLVSFSPSGN